jgi:hypothetical protein
LDKITGAKTEFRLKQWEKIIQTCQTSGMQVVSWCAQNNVNAKTYYYWLRKIRSMICETRESSIGSNEQQIVPLPFKHTKSSTTAAITIHLQAVSVDIQDGTSQATIEAVLAGLKNIC